MTTAVAEVSKGSAEVQLVTFQLGGERFGVDVHRVQEVNRMSDTYPLPDAPSFVEGVVNLRGRVIPIMDLRKRLGLPAREETPSTRILVADVSDLAVGMIVDAVNEVVRLPSGMIDPAPQMAGEQGSQYLKGIGKFEDTLVMLLDLESLLSESERAALS